MLASGVNILNVASAEVRTARRRPRFWTIVFFLSLFSIVGYLISCAFLGYSAVTSPSMGTGVPKYLFGNIDPTFFLMFQMAALFLAFDAGHQHTRNRIAEVLDSKSVTNFEYLAGRVLGIAGLLWLVAAANVLMMQLLGSIATATNIGIADTIEWYSFLNLLLIDGPVTLLIWCSIVVFLSCILRVRLLVAIVGFALMFSWFFLVLNTPYSLLAIVSPSSNDTLFVSDLLPQFASLPVIAIRTSAILAAIVLVAIGALLLRRQDSGSRLTKFLGLGVCLGLGSILYTGGSISVIDQYKAAEKWRNAHENHEWDTRIDLTEIAGKLKIHPRKHLTTDLSLSFKTNSNSSDKLTFTLNPSMRIDEIQLNGSPPNFTFQNGLLVMTTPSPLEPDKTHKLQIVAHGVPDERFAYFDSAFDYLRLPGVSNQTISLLGAKGSVYSGKYIALMPGVYWYPVPGPVRGDYLSAQKGLDYFDLDLSVELVSKDWQLVGTDAIAEASEGTNLYRVSPATPIHEIGLFASEFESASIEIEGITFNMYLHKQHSSNLHLLDEFSDAMKTVVKSHLQPFSEYGLNLPYQNLSFVEVPRQLRTVGGGWRMNSLEALPGMVLLKEHGYPTTRLDLALKRLNTREQDEDTIAEAALTLLLDYFRYGVATDNPWSSLPERLWSHRTSARGEHATALDQIVLSLISHLQQREQELFSIYSTLHIADTTALSLVEGTIGLEDGIENDRIPSTIGTTRRLKAKYSARLSVWNNLEKTGFSDFPSTFGHQHDLELMLLKCDQIASALLSVNGEQKVFAWLEDVLTSGAGSTYSYQELTSRAVAHEVIIDPFLTEWLRTSALPAYATSDYTTLRIADDERGDPRYQTSVAVRNTQPVGGFVRLQFPTKESWDWPHPYLTESPGVRIEAGANKRINLLTSYEIRSVYLDPVFSLHRGSVRLYEGSDSSKAQPTKQPAPFEEDSSWIPNEEIGIIVDDLDPGFEVEQRTIKISRPSRVGPLGWIRVPQLDGELDHGLPIRGDYYLFEYDAPSGVWTRSTELGAYGRFRKTVALNTDRHNNPKATFTTNLPESTVWKLDYHAPLSFDRGWDQGLMYQFLVSDNSRSLDAELDVYNWKLGWNTVGEFNLNAGEVSVDLVRTSKQGSLWADAIRWTKADNK